MNISEYCNGISGPTHVKKKKLVRWIRNLAVVLLSSKVQPDSQMLFQMIIGIEHIAMNIAMNLWTGGPNHLQVMNLADGYRSEASGTEGSGAATSLPKKAPPPKPPKKEPPPILAKAKKAPPQASPQRDQRFIHFSPLLWPLSPGSASGVEGYQSAASGTEGSGAATSPPKKAPPTLAKAKRANRWRRAGINDRPATFP